MSDTYHFQVNLGGMLDVLSNHLYKSPDVFLRELLQNGVDAITLRQKSQPDWNRGKITITVEPGRRLIFRDNGAGLSEEGIHRFLAVIGQSSKTELLEEFEDNGDTVMYAPGSGFYADPADGRSEIRIAYVHNCDYLRRAIQLLGKGIAAYNAKRGA